MNPYKNNIILNYCVFILEILKMIKYLYILAIKTLWKNSPENSFLNDNKNTWLKKYCVFLQCDVKYFRNPYSIYTTLKGDQLFS